jgi:hypothetical protein
LAIFLRSSLDTGSTIGVRRGASVIHGHETPVRELHAEA